MTVGPRAGASSDTEHWGSSATIAAALLALLVLAVYAPVRHAGFFYLDDDFYVTDNPFVRGGLTFTGLRHAFFGTRGGLWMPLAFMSHMADVSLFGLGPTGPHVVNVVFHVANTLLLFAFLKRTTRALAPSLLATAIFAVHPLRVESVAWIAERKDVLSAFFGLLTLHAWFDYTRAPTDRRYRVVMAATVLALLSKPMLVTLPLLLVCIDWWPLRRIGTPGADGRPLTTKALVREKIPLLALALAAAAITLLAASLQGALVALDGRPLGIRVAHALVAYVWYAAKTLRPTGLGVFYPYPTWSAWHVVGAALVIGATAALAVITRRRAPWFAAGLAWFAIALVPVSGIFQAGGQGMADRFTYLPAIGLVTAVVWSFHEAIRAPRTRAMVAGAAVLTATWLAVATYRQVTYWQTSEGLLAHTLDVTRDNWRMEDALGSVLANTGRYAEAEGHFATALRIRPDDGGAEYGVGLALDGLGRADEAVVHYREAVRLDPTYWRAHNNLGLYLARHGELERAMHHLSEAVRLNPAAADVAENLRSALFAAGFPKENAEGYLQGLRAWAAAIANDRGVPGGADYSASLTDALVRSRAAVVQGCVGTESAHGRAPFSLYVQVDASGALTAVTAMPPTPAARCVRDELRTAHAPSPPFAPFHARVSIPTEG